MDASREPLEAVLLDAGNTILGLDYRVLADTLAPGDPAVTPAAVARAEAAARKVVAPLLAGERRLSLEEAFACFAGAIAGPLGLDPRGAGPRRLLSLLLSSEGLDRAWCVPMPGAADALERLKASGYRLAVVSNGDGQGPRRLAEAGLADYFEWITDSGNVGVEKPEPGIFTLTLEKLGVAPGRAVHVGDFYQVDILGARRAGIRQGILVDPYGDWPEADCPRIAGVAELPALLEQLYGAPPVRPARPAPGAARESARPH